MVHRGGLSCCRTELVRHCHFTGKAPQPSSGPLHEAADSSRVMDDNQTKRAETHGTGAIAPGMRRVRRPFCCYARTTRRGAGTTLRSKHLRPPWAASCEPKEMDRSL